jgi:hypothetical protein
VIPNPYVVLGTAAAWLLTLLTVGWLMYARGHDDMRNAYTEQQLTLANANLKGAGKNNKVAAVAGDQHEVRTTIIHEKTREIHDSIQIPADSDPLLPVWFVRLLNRAASRDAAGDPYPGKSQGDPSDVRLSEAGRMLSDGWADKYYACRQQVIDTIELKPVLPPPPPDPSWLDGINPFR